MEKLFKKKIIYLITIVLVIWVLLNNFHKVDFVKGETNLKGFTLELPETCLILKSSIDEGAKGSILCRGYKIKYECGGFVEAPEFDSTKFEYKIDTINKDHIRRVLVTYPSKNHLQLVLESIGSKEELQHIWLLTLKSEGFKDAKRRAILDIMNSASLQY
ncbi:hypothetical protein [Roseivirga thermotolerans]|uniref:Uncharacterized protein n=1 Tax=Roseivirga thermotolerans TaxID=1758176 RepID=A0ABQ3IB10_9BACT|nr:hypothetical protein [Roseivirga thermotolerans]GHE72304.1 hypothetical protein GCM10011340_30720 [Roseivirga thermotolerans]